MPTHGLTCDRVMTFSDAELVDRLYETISVLSDTDDKLSDALFFLVDEVLERFARTSTERTCCALTDGREGSPSCA
jgi:hypothetical protein